MGNQIMKTFVKRPLQNYNVEQRALKAISKEKPIRAPQHTPKMQSIMDDIRQDPNLLMKHAKLDPEYKKNLKDVYLTSQGDWQQLPFNKPFPRDRETPVDYEYGLYTPEKVREGKASLKQVLKFLSDHQMDPSVCNAEKIASEYKLDLNDVKNILRYFKPFEIIQPPKRNEPSLLMKAIKA